MDEVEIYNENKELVNEIECEVTKILNLLIERASAGPNTKNVLCLSVITQMLIHFLTNPETVTTLAPYMEKYSQKIETFLSSVNDYIKYIKH